MPLQVLLQVSLQVLLQVLLQIVIKVHLHTQQQQHQQQHTCAITIHRGSNRIAASPARLPVVPGAHHGCSKARLLCSPSTLPKASLRCFVSTCQQARHTSHLAQIDPLVIVDAQLGRQDAVVTIKVQQLLDEQRKLPGEANAIALAHPVQ